MLEIVTSMVSEAESSNPSLTTRLKVIVMLIFDVRVGAVNVGELAVSSDSVTVSPAVCTH